MIAAPVDRRQQVFRNFSRLLKNRADQIGSHFRSTRHGSKHLVGLENFRHQKLHVAEWRAIGVHIIAPAQAGCFVESVGLPILTDHPNCAAPIIGEAACTGSADSPVFRHFLATLCQPSTLKDVKWLRTETPKDWLTRLSRLIPAECPVCGLEACGDSGLCAACCEHLPWISASCPICGEPLTPGVRAGQRCGRCLRARLHSTVRKRCFIT